MTFHSHYYHLFNEKILEDTYFLVPRDILIRLLDTLSDEDFIVKESFPLSSYGSCKKDIFGAAGRWVTVKDLLNL